MSNSRWKRQERELARVLGTERIPNSGRAGADVKALGWALQVKTRKLLPAWLWAAVDQAQRDAGVGERAAVVLSEVSQGRRARRLVVLDFDTWRGLLGEEKAG
jgi:hypothetical protein